MDLMDEDCTGLDSYLGTEDEMVPTEDDMPLLRLDAAH